MGGLKGCEAGGDGAVARYCKGAPLPGVSLRLRLARKAEGARRMGEGVTRRATYAVSHILRFNSACWASLSFLESGADGSEDEVPWAAALSAWASQSSSSQASGTWAFLTMSGEGTAF